MKRNSYIRPVRRSLGEGGSVSVSRGFREGGARRAVVPPLRDEGGFVNLRAMLALMFCLVGAALALLAGRDGVLGRGVASASLPINSIGWKPMPLAPRYMPVPGANSREEAADLWRLEQFWTIV